MVLELKNITKQYGNKKVLNGLDYVAEAGKIDAIVGENGCGKTTAFRVILGLIKKYRGEVNIDNNIKIAGYVNEARFFSALSAVDNMKVLIKDVKDDEIFEIAKKLDMETYINKRFGVYSMGMRKRCALLYLLLKKADVLVLDEPANGLDPLGMVLMKKVLNEEKAKGKTIIISTHLLNSLDGFADNIYLLKDGKLKSNLKIEKEETIPYVMEFLNDVDFEGTSSFEGMDDYVIYKNKIYFKTKSDKVPALVERFTKFGLIQVYKNQNTIEQKYIASYKEKLD